MIDQQIERLDTPGGHVTKRDRAKTAEERLVAPKGKDMVRGS